MSPSRTWQLAAALAALCGPTSGGGAPSPYSYGGARPAGRPPPPLALKGSSSSAVPAAPSAPGARSLQRQDNKGNNNKGNDKGAGAAITAGDTATGSTPPPSPLTGHPLHGRPVTANCLRQFAAADEAMTKGGGGDGAEKVPSMDDLVKPGCLEWLRANPSFDLPVPPPPPHGVSRTSALIQSDDGSRAVEVTYSLGPTDDSFAEKWRPKEALGDRARLKIDADGDGVPTKVSQLRFYLKGTFDRARTEAALAGLAFGGDAGPAELESATLRLWSITETDFGGWVAEVVPGGWDEGSLTWDGLVDGLAGGAVDLLPSTPDEVLAEFGPVRAEEWNEADLTARVSEMFAESANDSEDGGGWLSLRLSTDGTDGVIYGSKDGRHDGPELVLRFVVREEVRAVTPTADAADEGSEADAIEAEEDEFPVLPEIVQAEAPSEEAQGDTSSEPGAAAQADGADAEPVEASSPQLGETESSQAEDEVGVVLPAEDPAQADEQAEGGQAVEEDMGWISPAEMAVESPSEAEIEDESSLAEIEAGVVLPEDPVESDELEAEEEAPAIVAATVTSVVSSSFRMTVTALRTVRARHLRGGSGSGSGSGISVQQAGRRLVQSGEEKEAPAIAAHLATVYAGALTIAPSRVSAVFEDDVVQEDLDGDADWEGLSGVVRRGVFRVVGEFPSSSIFAFDVCSIVV